MAFDHPVEADRVDLNFSSIMARAPVIGSLMYLLGGHHAREEEEYASSTRKEMDLAIETTDSQISFTGSQRQQLKSAMKKSAPSLAPTDDSDNDSFQSALDCSDRHSEIFDSQSSFRRKKKELSWSDESGQNLVEYMDALPISTGKEIPLGNGFVTAGGAMTRSRSIRAQLQENHAPRDKASYLPRMAPHGGVKMPSMNPHHHHHQTANAGGIESPQWGWYTNLTPPTPEMYTSHPLQKKHNNPSSGSTVSTSSETSKPKRPSSTQPNPIFQSLPSQRKERAAHPTIPL